MRLDHCFLFFIQVYKKYRMLKTKIISLRGKYKSFVVAYGLWCDK